MRVELFPFQKRALADIRMKTAEAMGSSHRTHAPQVVSFTAPTGAGKTIIMASLIEEIFFGGVDYEEQPEAIFVWPKSSISTRSFAFIPSQISTSFCIGPLI